MKKYIQGHEIGEYIRSFMNQVTTLMPGYRNALKYAAVIYSSNDETTAFLKKRMYQDDIKKLYQLTELCIDDSYLADRELLNKGCNECIHIIVSGRLIYRKGVALLIDAVNTINTEISYIVDIYGEGPEKKDLEQKCIELGLESKIIFHGKIDFQEMQQRYMEGDIYVLPSLRESTGTAVFEALSNKLPLVCFNQNGAKYVVESDAGILVDIDSQDQIIKDMGLALKLLIEDKQLRINLGNRGFEKIKERYTWSKRVKHMDEVYRGLYKD